MREEKSREKKTAKASKFADQKASWGTGQSICVSLSFSISIWDLKERPTKRMEILFDHLNGENLRGYTGLRATKRFISISHFTIYIISNILFFTILFKYYFFNLSLFFFYISFFLFFSISLLSKVMFDWDNFENSLSLSYLNVCLVGIILKMMKKWEWFHMRRNKWEGREIEKW